MTDIDPALEEPVVPGETDETGEDQPEAAPAPEAEVQAPKPRRPRQKATEPEPEEVLLPGCVLPGPMEQGTANTAVGFLQDWLRARGLLPIGAQRGVLDRQTGEGIQQLQRRMKRAGAYPGPLHGRWDMATRNAACRHG